MPKSQTLPKTVAIIHPDLGIGGAQQLILNIAKSFDSEQEIDVTIFTSHYDQKHCLEESKNLNIEVRGNCCRFLPRSCCKKFHALFSYLKMLLTALHIALFGGQYDIILLDQISFPIPLLRLLTSAQIVYYCHFPDQLLCVQRNSFQKRIYRKVIDTIQEKTTRFAHKVFVNSKFTQTVFYKTFRSLAKTKTQVLYPCIDFKQFQAKQQVSLTQVCPQFQELKDSTILITSLNRYEFKKNIKLVLDIVSYMLQTNQKEFSEMLQVKQIHFCIAGGFDERVPENVNCYNQLTNFAESLFGKGEAQKHVTFLKSISNEQRKMLLKSSSVLLYTPENEHFGIVPLEAMFNGNIVMGCNSGGPTETIINNQTGYLMQGGAKQWATKLIQVIKLIQDPQNGKMVTTQMRLEAFEHVKRNFSFETFKQQLINSIFGNEKLE